MRIIRLVKTKIFTMIVSRTLLLLCFFAPVLFQSESAIGAENTFLMVENKSGKLAKVAVPGGKPVRVKPGETDIEIPIEVTTRNGVEVKAWWISDPRQLCVIFVRYEGRVIVGGKKNIRCLGN